MGNDGCAGEMPEKLGLSSENYQKQRENWCRMLQHPGPAAIRVSPPLLRGSAAAVGLMCDTPIALNTTEIPLHAVVKQQGRADM